MHPPKLRGAALELISAGVNDCEIARRLSLPRTTVRDIRRPRRRLPARDVCPRCWRPTSPVAFTAADYAELLGLYLGDGHIAQGPGRRSCDCRWTPATPASSRMPRRCSHAASQATVWAGSRRAAAPT